MIDPVAELIKSIYGTDDIKQVVDKKTTDAQERVFVTSNTKRVELSAKSAEKYFKACNIEFKDGMQNRILERTLTDETVDRYGDIVESKGGDFTNFKKNPSLLAFHDSRNLPIGSVIRIWREGTATKGWLFFMDNDLDPTGRSDAAFRMAAAGILKAGSIGFMAKEIREPEEKERKALGMGRWGVIFTKWELVEFSVCPVPANPNALSFDEIRHKDILSLESARSIMDIYPDETVCKIADILEGDEFGAKIVSDELFCLTNDELNEKAGTDAHVARLRSPSSFNSDTFRKKSNCTIYESKEVPDTASVVWGKLAAADKPQDNPVPQSIVFPTKDWTEEAAKAWLKDNDISVIKFESAKKDIEVPAVDPVVVELTSEPVKVDLSEETKDLFTTFVNKATLLVDKLDIFIDASNSRSGGHGLSGDSDDELYGDILNAKSDFQASVASIGNEGKTGG